MSNAPLHLLAKPVEETLYERLRTRIQKLSVKPGLATVLVGEDPASQVYVRKKGEMCVKLGMQYKDHKLQSKTTQKELEALIDKLNADPNVHGILVQSPLPKPLDERAIYDRIDPKKDVDCFHPANVGLLSQGRARFLPCTPAGVMKILEHYKISLAGLNALVVGRSDIVGKPMAALLLQANATVTTAHSKTKDLARHISEADLVVAAIGKTRFLGGELPWKRDAVVIDVGINRDAASGKLCGDVDFAAVSPKVRAITPVPGGVGPMTIAILMENTVRSAELACGQ